MKTTCLTFLFLLTTASTAHAFAPAVVGNTPRLVSMAATPPMMDDGPDFDAPSSRAAAVGNAVRSPPPKNPLEFLVDLFQKNGPGTPPMDLDDECYLGKDGTADECVDFDAPPMKRP